MPSARFEIFGRVQGVGYRAFVQRQAQALALAGWVRNRDDGAVEVQVHGSTPALDQLEIQLRLGPPHASVARLSRTAAPASPAAHDFTILD